MLRVIFSWLGPVALIAGTVVGHSAGGRSADRTDAWAGARPTPTPDPYVDGRSEDARVAGVAYRLATQGMASCPVPVPGLGLALQHLTQFELPDRAGMIAAYALDRGPGVMLVVPDSPAAKAGVLPGDVVLAVDGIALPPEDGRDLPFVAARAHARSDAILDRIDAAATRPITLGILRDGTTRSLKIAPVPACPSRVHLARSGQRNAFADGTHVFLTTGLLARLRGDDELAFFVAHEMAHNILGHAAVMRGDTVRRGLRRTLGKSGEIIRGVERDADMLGAQMMIAAGYDPVAGAAALLRLDGANLDGPFGEHASPKERIAAIRGLVRSHKARQAR